MRTNRARRWWVEFGSVPDAVENTDPCRGLVVRSPRCTLLVLDDTTEHSGAISRVVLRLEPGQAVRVLEQIDAYDAYMVQVCPRQVAVVTPSNLSERLADLMCGVGEFDHGRVAVQLESQGAHRCVRCRPRAQGG